MRDNNYHKKLQFITHQLVRARLIEHYSKYFEKSNYLKFLAKNQSKEYKIIPIIEYMNGVKEESFLFRTNFKSKKVMIIWENTNEGRATYIFQSKISEMDKFLRGIESFICNEIDNKRSYIRSKTVNSRKLRKELNLVTTINHTTLEDFRNNFRKVSDFIFSL